MALAFKKHLSIVIALLVVSCNSKTPSKITTATPNLNDTFKSIVKQENIDFYKKDLNAWSKHFVHSNAVYWVCVEDEVTLRATGWDELNQFVGQWMKENPTPDSDSLLKQDVINDFNVELSNDLAFVRYKKNHMMPDGKVKVLLESRTFKLVNNEWKILGLTSAPGYATSKSTANIFVHNDIPK
jgi:hypothetical protein